jgi:hypothetical protein
MKEKVYIAGQITNCPNYEELFDDAKVKYESMGYIVINPAELPGGMSPADYMRICIPMVDTSDIVVFLPNWINSKGAKIENGYADYIGKRIIYE